MHDSKLEPVAHYKIDWTWDSLVKDVETWAEAKDLLTNSTSLFQSTKTLEEVAELQHALLRLEGVVEPQEFDKAREAVIDAYGDILVTLIIGMAIESITPIEALAHAYSIIKKRTGKTVNGIFVKDS